MNSASGNDDLGQEQLIADFKVVMDDAEALLKATANHGDQKVDELRAKASESLRKVGERITQSQAALLANGKKAAKATDVYVHDNPWAALGIAGGVGLVLGLLMRRS
jgi:ElaB/YqjD/DUF883 family membrane-anchored ribosome-binding protein